MYEDILLPFDGSEGAAAVLVHAAEIANWADATIHVLSVADTARDSVTVVEDQVVDALVREGRDVVEEAADQLATLGVAHETDVVQGNPAEAIADYAERHQHDLVVMPTHGRTGLSRYLLGSVSEKVVRLSSVPVLTARMQPDERLGFPYQDVLVPTDGSPAAERAAGHAVSLASALDATLHALSVVEDDAVPLVDADPDREAGATSAIEAVESEAAAHGVAEPVSRIEHGSPVEAIRNYVDANAIDAVVMGTTGRRATRRILLGSVAEETVRSAPVPVVTVGGGE